MLAALVLGTTIAVLPPECLGVDPERCQVAAELLGRGFEEEGYHVVDPRSMPALPAVDRSNVAAVAREMGADVALLSRIAGLEKRVYFTGELVDVRNDRTLLKDGFTDRSLDAFHRMSSRTARALSRQLPIQSQEARLSVGLLGGAHVPFGGFDGALLAGGGGLRFSWERQGQLLGVTLETHGAGRWTTRTMGGFVGSYREADVSPYVVFGAGGSQVVHHVPGRRVPPKHGGPSGWVEGGVTVGRYGPASLTPRVRLLVGAANQDGQGPSGLEVGLTLAFHRPRAAGTP